MVELREVDEDEDGEGKGNKLLNGTREAWLGEESTNGGVDLLRSSLACHA